MFGVEVSDDDRWVVITAFQGSSDRSEIYLIDRQAPGVKPFPVFTGFDAAYAFIDAAGGRLLLSYRTWGHRAAGSSASIRFEPLRRHRSTLVEESADKLSIAVIVTSGMLVTSYLHNASDSLRLFSLSGEPAGASSCPSIGSLTGIQGEPSRHGDVSRVHFVRAAVDELPLRLRHGTSRPVWSSSAAHRPRRVRDDAGLVSVEGRHAGVDVSRAPARDSQRDGNRPVLLTRLRRVQHQPDAGVRSGELRAARRRRDLRGREPARRRRIRRSVARGRDVRAEAERVRRFHRGRRVADRQRLLEPEADRDRRRAATAGCSSPP